MANLWILPVQPLVMYLGGTAAMVGLAFLPLGRLLGWAEPVGRWPVRWLKFPIMAAKRR